MSPPPEGRDRHYWPDSEPDADRLGATQVIPARGAPKITMPPPQSADRMSLQERANAIFGELGTKVEVTEVASGVDNVATNIRNAVGGGIAVGVGVVREVFDNVAGLLGIADNAEKIAMAAQQQLQDITNETNTPGWSGYSWSTIFSGADGTPLPSTDWATTRIAIVGDDGHAGIINNSTDGDHFCTVRDIHKFASDSQSASIVVGKKWSFSEDRWTSIRLRCDDDDNPTQGAVCWVRPGNVRIGRFSGGSNFYWTTINQSIKPGDIVRFRCHGDNYYVLVNGKVVVSWTDTSAAVSKGAGYRHAAFTQEYLNGLFADQASFQVASWAMADWLPPGGAVSTPSWQIRRGTNTAVALAVGHGGQAPMPTSFYTINDRSTDVSVDLTAGAVTIGVSGWYEIAATSINRDDNDSGGFGAANGNTVSAWRSSPWVLYVDGVANIGPVMAGVAVKAYLAAGQVVRVGVVASTPNYPVARGGTDSVDVAATSNITHVAGGPSASFIGRRVD
ncbi:minor tail protein [Gordonia phage UmaThurman]|uniref:minor tail protein n=1 Tax=Gordonia phage UmaThurman TaxID=1821563 RepID=UPI00078DA314|nr:minor tail protein [Gordonia phage UmaThurman]AMS03928.1 minor tail protein [Gordonia phage UmaThurman]